MTSLLLIVCLAFTESPAVWGYRPFKSLIKRIPINCNDPIKCPVPAGCIRSSCPKPVCANPILVYGECCPSCAHSHCKFEGCVQYEPGGKVRWWPKPCLTCRCFGNYKLCSGPMCGRPTKCPANGVITKLGYKPYKCCPYCDYGVPEQECQPVPTENMEQFHDEQGNCSGSYPLHKCDKIGFRRHGRKFRCMESWGERQVNGTGEGCGAFTYRDVVSCELKEDQYVYNTLGCDMYV